jgi:4-hydroxy-L-threonine phosphate dehydrogenase PdxA
MKPRVCITLGDPGGIGSELVVKLLASPGVTDAADIYVLGSETEFKNAQEAAETALLYTAVSEISEAQFGTGRVHFQDVPIEGEYAPGRVSAASGRHTLAALGIALDLAAANAVDAVCFAPLNKESLRAGGNPFEDELHWFAERLSLDGFVCEINVLEEVWTSRVSSHIPMREAHSYITPDRIRAAAELLDQAMRDAGRSAPRIAVCGFNAHAGDGGLLGAEEIEIIAPAIAHARQTVETIDGPFPADTIFLRVKRGDYDAVVTMFHDQGQIALKLMGFERGVSIQGGLPFPVTTCSHGTAFDIVGQQLANVSAFRHAFDMACAMAAAHRAPAAMPGADPAAQAHS